MLSSSWPPGSTVSRPPRGSGERSSISEAAWGSASRCSRPPWLVSHSSSTPRPSGSATDPKTCSATWSRTSGTERVGRGCRHGYLCPKRDSTQSGSRTAGQAVQSWPGLVGSRMVLRSSRRVQLVGSGVTERSTAGTTPLRSGQLDPGRRLDGRVESSSETRRRRRTVSYPVQFRRRRAPRRDTCGQLTCKLIHSLSSLLSNTGHAWRSAPAGGWHTPRSARLGHRRRAHGARSRTAGP